MATKLYVGNLSFSSTDQTLENLFSKAGTVTSSQIVTDRYTGQSRGFGFVEMSTEAEAQNAISTLNGKEVDGRTLTVNESRPRENNGERSFGGGRSNGGGGRSSGGGNRGGGGNSRW